MNRFTTTMMILSLGFGCQLANAARPQDPPTVIVRFADLDLTHSQGVAVLYKRLRNAAETVCTPQNGRDLASQTRFEMCWRSALDTAVGTVDQPAVTAYYRAQFNRRGAAIQVAQK